MGQGDVKMMQGAGCKIQDARYRMQDITDNYEDFRISSKKLPVHNCDLPDDDCTGGLFLHEDTAG